MRSTAVCSLCPVTSLHVLVAGGPKVLRRGIEALLTETDDVAEVVSVPDGMSAAAEVRRRSAELVVLVCRGPDDATEEALCAIRAEGAASLVVLGDSDPTFLERAARYPADGFMMTEELSEDSLSRALEALSRGEMPFPPVLGRIALSALREPLLPMQPPALSPRERETLVLLAMGLSNKEIGLKLDITEHGAKRHVSRILSKLNCSNRTMAARTAHRMGLLADADR
ncbi:Transcriptional regulatory protein LnrK [Streptomyces sp. enrichment culture]